MLNNNIETYNEHTFKNSNVIECKIPLSEESISKVVSACSMAVINKSECQDGYLSYSGKAIFTVLYEEEGSLKKSECGVEFSYKTEVKNLKNGAIVCLNAKTGGEKLSFLNGIASISATLTVCGEFANKSVTEVASIEDGFLTKKYDMESLNEVCFLQKSISVEDEFELEYCVKDILCHDEKIIVSGVEAGIGVVNVSGEVEVTAYASMLDGVDVCKIRKTIPFNAELECADVYPNCYVTQNFSNVQAVIKAYVDEGKNKSNFSIECIAVVNCKVFENVSYSVVSDAYSLENELNVVKEDVVFNKFLSYSKREHKISGEIIGEISKNDRLICVSGVKIENDEYEITDGALIVSGLVNAVAVYKGDDGIKYAQLNCPYNVSISLNGNCVSDVNVEVSCLDVRLIPSGFSYSYALTVCYGETLKASEEVVKSIEKGAQIQKNDCAISVLIAKKGETLWDVSKRLGANEDEILKYNDIEFPLCGDERIVIFREDKN